MQNLVVIILNLASNISKIDLHTFKNLKLKKCRGFFRFREVFQGDILFEQRVKLFLCLATAFLVTLTYPCVLDLDFAEK